MHGPGKVRVFKLGSGKRGWLVVVAALAQALAWGVGKCGRLVVVAAIALTGLTAHDTGRAVRISPFCSILLRASPCVSVCLRVPPCVSVRLHLYPIVTINDVRRMLLH